MAQRLVLELEDDLDGDPADETIAFALDGTKYEIDLTSEHAELLRAALARWIGAARRDGRTASHRGPVRVPTAADPLAVRRWAKANGVEVSPRGRISVSVIEQFHAAGN